MNDANIKPITETANPIIIHIGFIRLFTTLINSFKSKNCLE